MTGFESLPGEILHRILDIVFLEANNIYPEGFKLKWPVRLGLPWYSDVRVKIQSSPDEVYDCVILLPELLALRLVNRMCLL